MRIETHNGEVLVLGSYAAYLDESYEEDKRIRWLVDRAWERMLRDPELAYDRGGSWGFWHDVDIPSTLMATIGAEVRFTELGVNVDTYVDEDPLILAGPLRTWLGEHRDDAVRSSGARWVVLVWDDVGYSSPSYPPDRCYVIDARDENEASYETCMVADLRPTGWVICQSDEVHQWEDLHSEEWQSFADNLGARCPECGGKLAVDLYYGGESSWLECGEVPWNGGQPCEECRHNDHFLRVCGVEWSDQPPCPCSWPFDAEDIPTVREEIPGQLQLSLA